MLIKSNIKWLTRANVYNLIFFIALGVFVFYTPARVTLMRGLMKIGMFKPDITTTPAPIAIKEELKLQDSRGERLNLASLKGKVVFINFWATWCPPCIAELPSIAALRNKVQNNKNIVFLIVDADGDLNKSLRFMDKHNYKLPVYAAVSKIPAGMMGNAIPATIVLNKEGKIIFRHDGAADYSGAGFEKFLITLAL